MKNTKLNLRDMDNYAIEVFVYSMFVIFLISLFVYDEDVYRIICHYLSI